MIEVCVASDRGQLKPTQEDSFLCEPQFGIFVVADGMGGHRAGEVASNLVVSLFRKFYCSSVDGTGVAVPLDIDNDGSRDESILKSVIRWANNEVYNSGKKSTDRVGMGSTVVAMHVHDNKITIANLGDSRCYQIRNGTIKQLTRDHTLIQEMSEALNKSVTQLLIENVQPNILSQACGVSPWCVPFAVTETVQPNDIFLLCSDGLTNELSDEQLLSITEFEDFPNQAQFMVDSANKAGGHDNITALLVRFS